MYKTCNIYTIFTLNIPVTSHFLLHSIFTNESCVSVGIIICTDIQEDYFRLLHFVMLMFAVCFDLPSGDSIWQHVTSNVIQQFEQTGVILSPWWAPWRPTSLFDPCFWIQKDAESRCRCPEIVWAQSFPYHPAFQPLAAFMQKGSWRDLWWQIFHLFWATMCNSKENISKTHGISFISHGYASAYA